MQKLEREDPTRRDEFMHVSTLAFQGFEKVTVHRPIQYVLLFLFPLSN